MTVLHYTDTFDVESNPETKFIVTLSKAMVSNGAIVHIFSHNIKTNISIKNIVLHEIKHTSIFLKELYEIKPDIIHIHGCWSYYTAKILLTAHKKGFDTILSTYGGLYSWNIRKNFWFQKLPRIITYQFIAVKCADLIHATGQIEYNNIKKLHWNKNIKIIQNCLFTHKIDDAEMSKQMLSVYQYIMDQHVFLKMNISTQQAFYTLLKAGLNANSSGLRPNITSISIASIKNLSLLQYQDWRKISIFANEQDICPIINNGIKALNIKTKDVVFANGIYNKIEIKNIEDACEKINLLYKKVLKRTLSIKDIVQLYDILRNNDFDEYEFKKQLHACHKLNLLSRLEYILIEMTDIEEGFLLLPAKNDFITRFLKNIIYGNSKV